MFNNVSLFDLLAVMSESTIKRAFFSVYAADRDGNMQRIRDKERFDSLPACDLRVLRLTGLYARDDRLYISVTMD